MPFSGLKRAVVTIHDPVLSARDPAGRWQRALLGESRSRAGSVRVTGQGRTRQGPGSPPGGQRVSQRSWPRPAGRSETRFLCSKPVSFHTSRGPGSHAVWTTQRPAPREAGAANKPSQAPARRARGGGRRPCLGWLPSLCLGPSGRHPGASGPHRVSFPSGPQSHSGGSRAASRLHQVSPCQWRAARCWLGAPASEGAVPATPAAASLEPLRGDGPRPPGPTAATGPSFQGAVFEGEGRSGV